MTATVSIVLPNDGTWTEIAVGPSEVIVQLKSINPCIVFAGTTIPNAGTTVGIRISQSDQGVAFPPMTTGDRMWARAEGAASLLHVVRT